MSLTDWRARNYGILRLLFLDCLGGAIDALAMRAFSQLYASAPPFSGGNVVFLGLLGLAFVLLFVLPIFLCFIFWVTGQGSRFVPPLHMQILASAIWVAYAAVQTNDPTSWATPAVMFGIAGGLIQDRIAVGVLGKFGERNQVVTASAIVKTGINAVKEVLVSSRNRENFALAKQVEKTDRGYLLRVEGWTGNGYLELEEGDKPNETYVNIAYYHYDRWAYSIRKTPDLENWPLYTVTLLKTIFAREKNPVEVVDNADAVAHTEVVVDHAMEDLIGLLMRAHGLSTWKWLALGTSFVLWVVSAILIIAGVGIVNIVATIGVALYASYETAHLLRKP
jgi:hypothetical protein